MLPPTDVKSEQVLSAFPALLIVEDVCVCVCVCVCIYVVSRGVLIASLAILDFFPSIPHIFLRRSTLHATAVSQKHKASNSLCGE